MSQPPGPWSLPSGPTFGPPRPPPDSDALPSGRLRSEAVDPDVDLSIGTQLREFGRGHRSVVAVVALGGVIGSLARYQAGIIWHTADGAFPTTTFSVNLLGCLIIGVFMTVITEIWTAHRLLRPFVGTGILGGFTTFSTYSLDIAGLLRTGHSGTALLYLAATAVGAIAAVALGMLGTRRLVALRRNR
jgi:CrcB protein